LFVRALKGMALAAGPYRGRAQRRACVPLHCCLAAFPCLLFFLPMAPSASTGVPGGRTADLVPLARTSAICYALRFAPPRRHAWRLVPFCRPYGRVIKQRAIQRRNGRFLCAMFWRWSGSSRKTSLKWCVISLCGMYLWQADGNHWYVAIFFLAVATSILWYGAGISCGDIFLFA